MPITASQNLMIPREFEGLNEILGKAKTHWSVYRQLKERNTMYVKASAKEALTPIGVSFDCWFTWYCKDKMRDPDNIASAVKFIFDGMIAANIIPNDGWKQISSIHHVFCTSHSPCIIGVFGYDKEANDEALAKMRTNPPRPGLRRKNKRESPKRRSSTATPKTR